MNEKGKANTSSASNIDASDASGGIFSTPDLTIETENIPANVGGAPVIDETAADPNASRIASAFANTDAMSQSQDVAAAMQARSTATGDIKLAPSVKPKSKAPLIIIALLAAVTATGIMI